LAIVVKAKMLRASVRSGNTAPVHARAIDAQDLRRRARRGIRVHKVANALDSRQRDRGAVLESADKFSVVHGAAAERRLSHAVSAAVVADLLKQRLRSHPRPPVRVSEERMRRAEVGVSHKIKSGKTWEISHKDPSQPKFCVAFFCMEYSG